MGRNVPVCRKGGECCKGVNSTQEATCGRMASDYGAAVGFSALRVAFTFFDKRHLVGGAESLPASSAMRQLGCGGLTRRLRRGRWGCRPEEGSTFFRSERKYQRKPAARHSGKKAFIAHFGGGARNVARNGVGQLSPAFGARSCSPFSAVKMGKAFSLRCLSPLVSPAVGAGQTQIAVLGMFQCSLDDGAAQKNRIVFFCG